MVAVSSWGRLGQWEHQVQPLRRHHGGATALKGPGPGLAYGMGRSYGDACLNPGGTLWQTAGLDRLRHFDAASGRLVCEPGVLLGDIQRVFAPQGWMLPVTPGTQFVTVGGAVANDVHGKNHHVAGNFGHHVLEIELMRTEGRLLRCGPALQPEWFAATVGGLGLTGVITEVTLQLRAVKGPWLSTESLPYGSLTEFFALADSSEAGWEHTVSWIDCLSSAGRGIFMRANPADHAEPAPPSRVRTMPFVPPVSLVNGLTLHPFNSLYFNLKKQQAGASQVHYAPFFYPLDNLRHWNRMYGPRGFFQYQSVVPRAVGQDAVAAMLKAISACGEGSFLAVLKTFGERPSLGMLSFPQPGVTLALDFPNRGAGTLKLLERLDDIVREAGGRLYPAKDARMPRALFEAGYPRLVDFSQYRDAGISSALSRRLMGA
ncbi:MAG: FAD-binding oxidoreductase [Pseudomonadota bacterium]